LWVLRHLTLITSLFYWVSLLLFPNTAIVDSPIHFFILTFRYLVLFYFLICYNYIVRAAELAGYKRLKSHPNTSVIYTIYVVTEFLVSYYTGYGSLFNDQHQDSAFQRPKGSRDSDHVVTMSIVSRLRRRYFVQSSLNLNRPGVDPSHSLLIHHVLWWLNPLSRMSIVIFLWLICKKAPKFMQTSLIGIGMTEMHCRKWMWLQSRWLFRLLVRAADAQRIEIWLKRSVTSEQLAFFVYDFRAGSLCESAWLASQNSTRPHRLNDDGPQYEAWSPGCLRPVTVRRPFRAGRLLILSY
jgi:hypothetical protein